MNQIQKTTTRQTFEQIYRNHIGLVQFALGRFRFPVQEQEDLIQEVFLRYLEHQDKVEHLNPKTFLLVVARNLAIDVHRKQKRRGADRHLPIDNLQFEIPDEQDTEQKQKMAAVQLFIETIRNDKQASTLVQYYDECLSIKQIAERSNQTTSTVSSQLGRQRRKYRCLLETCLNG